MRSRHGSPFALAIDAGFDVALSGSAINVGAAFRNGLVVTVTGFARGRHAIRKGTVLVFQTTVTNHRMTTINGAPSVDDTSIASALV